MKIRYVLFGVIGVLAAGVGGLYLWADRHPALAPIEPPDPSAFDQALVARGELLASAGYCDVCHTSTGGQPFAGNLPLETPFGVIRSTNITPDPETGIGSWSEEAFRRAMHEGISADGHYLYPAFPFDHFTLVTDEDVAALYAYLMTREPVPAEPEENELAFPFDRRILLAGWRLLFHESRRFEPDPDRSDAWNRGMYLVEGLGHCGACHTPRNRFGALDEDAKFAGAHVEGWYAPALNSDAPTPASWSDLALVNYLIDGWDLEHGIAAGPMQPVVDHLARLPEDDVFAIAEYVLSFQEGSPDTGRREAALTFADERELPGTTLDPDDLLDDPALRRGQERFASSCANCHRLGSDTTPIGLLTSVAGPSPQNLVNVLIEGIRPPDGVPEKSMPRFSSMSDEEIADMVRFMRAHFTEEPPWDDAEIQRSIATGRHIAAGR